MLRRRNMRWIRLMLVMAVWAAVAAVFGRGVGSAGAAPISGKPPTQAARSSARMNESRTAARATSADGFETVFTDTFTSTEIIRPEWYPSPVWSLVRSPNGKIYMGAHGSEVHKLNLVNLPVHTKVRLSFDFFTLYPSGGSTPWYGTYGTNPAYHHHFKVNSSATPAVDFDNTFCNIEDAPANTQSYPIPGSVCFTGNTGIGTLGYPNYGSFKGDVRYRISLTLDHTQQAFDASFMGTDGYGSPPMWGLDNVSVEIAGPPVIAQQPGPDSGELVYDRNIYTPYWYTLAVQATGEPLTYQWYANGSPIPNATANSYALEVGDGTNGFVYKVVVSNSFGVVQSRTITVVGEFFECTCDPDPVYN